MPIISIIGRRSLQVRLLVWTIYSLLIIGATTMVYPFLLMLSGSTKSSVDSPTADMVPQFMYSEVALYRKYVEALFNEHLEVAKNVYQSDDASFRVMQPPTEPNAALVDVWRDFLSTRELPSYTYTIGHVEARVTRGVMPSHLRRFKAQLIERFDDDIAAVNRAMQTDFPSWNAFAWSREEYQQRRNTVSDLPFDLAFNEFKAAQPLEDRYYFSVEGFYRYQYLKSQYTDDLAVYNREHGTDYNRWDQVHLDRRLPRGVGRTDLEREDWQEFARTIVSLLWVRIDEDAAPVYQQYLAAKYRDISVLNAKYETDYARFDEVSFPSACPPQGLPASDWDTFLQGWEDPESGAAFAAPASAIYIHSVDFQFRDYLQERFVELGAINEALGLEISDWLEILPPQRDWHYLSGLFLRKIICPFKQSKEP